MHQLTSSLAPIWLAPISKSSSSSPRLQPEVDSGTLKNSELIELRLEPVESWCCSSDSKNSGIVPFVANSLIDGWTAIEDFDCCSSWSTWIWKISLGCSLFYWLRGCPDIMINFFGFFYFPLLQRYQKCLELSSFCGNTYTVKPRFSAPFF